MNKKYFIINVANRFYIILKCTQQQLSDYVNYGINYSKDNDGKMNLSRLTKWLIDHHTAFRAEVQPIKNIIIKMFTKKSAKFINKQAIKSHMMIPDTDMEQLVSAMEKDDYSLCWNFDNTIQ